MPLPDKIFLQLGGEQFTPPEQEDFDKLRALEVITWDDERVFDSDIAYIRTDISKAAIEEAISHEREKRGFVVAENKKLTDVLKEEIAKLKKDVKTWKGQATFCVYCASQCDPLIEFKALQARIETLAGDYEATQTDFTDYNPED